MKVDPSQARNSKELWRNDLAVGDDHDSVWRNIHKKVDATIRSRCDRAEKLLNYVSSANTFTGDAEISWPRPRGRSGCVTTAAISNRESARSCLRDGRPNAGVPQNTMRSGVGAAIVVNYHSPFLRNLRMRRRIRSRLSMLRCWKKALHSDDRSRGRKRAQEGFRRAFQTNFHKASCARTVTKSGRRTLPRKPGKERQPSSSRCSPSGVNDFRVRDYDFRFRIFADAGVNHGEPQADADLRRGEAYALRGIHGDEHIRAKLAQFVIKISQRLSTGCSRTWVAIFHDRDKFSHLWEARDLRAFPPASSFFAAHWCLCVRCASSLGLCLSRCYESCPCSRLSKSLS